MQKSDTESLKYGSRMALIGIGEILLLALFKATLGYFTGLVVLMADALSSFGDVLTLVASFIGLKISRRRADEKFKYGYYKAETFAAFVTSVIIIYFGIEVLMESIERISAPETAQLHYLALFSVVVSTLASIQLSRMLQRAGKKINSLALIDTGKEKKLDIVVQAAVLVGIGANFYHIPYLEGAIGVIISGLILKVGLETAKESLFFLLDYFDDQKLVNKIKKIIKTRSRIVKDVKEVRMRRAGTFIFGEAFIEVNPYAQTKDIRSELKNLQEQIAKTSRYLKDFLVFVVIPLPARVRVAVPVKEDRGLNSAVAPTFAETRAYVFVDVSNKKIDEYYAKNFDFKPTDIKGIASFLEREKVNVVINNDMHSLLFYHLRRLQNIDVYPNFSNVGNVENTVKLLLIDT